MFREGEIVTARPALPRLPRRVLDVLDRDELEALEAAAPTERDRLIIRVLADCGLRAEGLCGLKVDDIVRRDRQAYLRVSRRTTASERSRSPPLYCAALSGTRRAVGRRGYGAGTSSSG